MQLDTLREIASKIERAENDLNRYLCSYEYVDFIADQYPNMPYTECRSYATVFCEIASRKTDAEYIRNNTKAEMAQRRKEQQALRERFKARKKFEVDAKAIDA